MKKILITAIFTISIFSVKAQQTVTYENINFTNLYGGMINGNTNELPNYHISNTLTGFGGDWGLDIKWWGGVKLRSSLGVLYMNKWGNVGINTEDPKARLDIDGDLRTSGGITGSDIVSGGSNAWKFHTPDDGRSSLYIAPLFADGTGDWDKGTEFRAGNIAVRGKLEAKEVKVTQSPTADFVFEEDYALPTLEEIEKHIKEKKHLPEIASAKEMEKEGVNIGEFQIKLLQKIEELTLYSIDQNKQIKTQSYKIKQLELENEQIKSLLDRVEKLENSKTKQP
ncbi:hypothetical protein [Epilithonimonas zeae]|uniref:hypothetical protein n=1 Tax=Epilithonimonas zeae TaxID=1416779 RepID=UPI00200C2BC9|nr:hypothetical protein [Epilithonimonas zeae]